MKGFQAANKEISLFPGEKLVQLSWVTSAERQPCSFSPQHEMCAFGVIDSIPWQ